MTARQDMIEELALLKQATKLAARRHAKGPVMAAYIGRMGELFAAIELDGDLEVAVNQRGFDMIANGERISIKTTAHTNVRRHFDINTRTLEFVDRLIVVRISFDTAGEISIGFDSNEPIADVMAALTHTGRYRGPHLRAGLK